MAEEASGFLGRWARRKTDALQGKPLDEPARATAPPWVEDGASPNTPLAVPAATAPVAADVAEQPEKKLLSLDDVKLLTQDSDFKPFMTSDVGPEVRNAAMKKLFADPHFNVMDGLDIYIDDYSKSDPIPEAMLRAMTSSKFLKLFDDEEDKEKEKQEEVTLRENANNAADQTVAQSQDDSDGVEPRPAPQINSSQPGLLNNSVASQQDHDNSHLRLQPDHAAPEPEARRSTE